MAHLGYDYMNSIAKGYDMIYEKELMVYYH